VPGPKHLPEKGKGAAAHPPLGASVAGALTLVNTNAAHDQECDAHAHQSRVLGLGRYLKTGYHSPWWSAKELALLGTLPDDGVAALVGRAANAVRQKWRALGLPNPHDRRRSVFLSAGAVAGRRGNEGLHPHPVP
jgi:hypothetical protein